MHKYPLRMYSIGERCIAVSTIGPTPVVSASADVTDVAAAPVPTGATPAVVRGAADVPRS